MHGSFLPKHPQTFPPQKQQEERGGGADPLSVRTDFPDTGTPDSIQLAHVQEDAFERSERIAASEHMVPADDATEWIESEEDDWLDKDASR